MSTYREQVYLILDELKGISDDFSFTEEHIMYLLDKYRAFVLSQKYGDIKKEIAETDPGAFTIAALLALHGTRRREDSAGVAKFLQYCLCPYRP